MAKNNDRGLNRDTAQVLNSAFLITLRSNCGVVGGMVRAPQNIMAKRNFHTASVDVRHWTTSRFSQFLPFPSTMNMLLSRQFPYGNIVKRDMTRIEEARCSAR
jgi:hypothetical protein